MTPVSIPPPWAEQRVERTPMDRDRCFFPVEGRSLLHDCKSQNIKICEHSFEPTLIVIFVVCSQGTLTEKI